MIGAIALGDHASSVEELINLAQNLDCYWIYPSVHNEEDYGHYLVDELEEPELPEEAKNISCMRNTGGTQLSMTGTVYRTGLYLQQPKHIYKVV